MAQIGAILVFCSSCKILYFANSVHPKIATDLFVFQNRVLNHRGGEKFTQFNPSLVDALSHSIWFQLNSTRS